MSREEWALVLAGGKATRLAPTLGDRPKLLAPVDGRPFLSLLLELLASRGFKNVCFLLGFRSEPILSALEHAARVHPSFRFEHSIEPEALGTAGALKLAERFCRRDFLLINGDTYLPFDPDALFGAHERNQAVVTLAAAGVADSGRYGALDLAPDGRVLGFREKAAGGGPGLINGGIYVLAPRVLDLIPAGRAVSLENDTFPALLRSGERLIAVEQGGPFFDIGTEQSLKDFTDYCRANRSHG